MAEFRRCRVEKMDDIGMDLFQRDEFEVRCVEDGLEQAAVLEDVFLSVPFGEAQIENLFAVLIRNTAALGAEAVHEPGELCERGYLEDSYAADGALGPGSCGADGST